MSSEIVTLPCLTDNYAYLLHDNDTGATAIVDVPEAAPVREALAERGWTLTDILVTHHHFDHIGGVETLKAETGARVVGAAADRHRLPPLDLEVAEGDTLSIGGLEGRVFEVPGHTIGHVAFHFPIPRALFSADSLMVLGCGRLFEGDAHMMWNTLSRLATLPPDTLIFSGHEYAATNVAFALSVEPDNEALKRRAQEIASARAGGKPTVPALLAQEMETNPFLRASELKRNVDMAGSPDPDVFAELRRRRDRF